MRSVGTLRNPRDLVAGEHVCWAFEGGDDLRAVASSYLRAGVDAGERVVWIGAGEPRPLTEMIAGVGDVDDLVRSGQLDVQDVRAVYDTGDAAAQVRQFRSLAARAVDDGYAGLRVIADNTPLVRNREDRLDFVTYERLIDDMIAESPIIGMCAFDADALGDDGLADIACVHAARGGWVRESSFSLYRSGHALVLAGEVDLAHTERFAAALRGSLRNPNVSSLVLSELTYIDIGGARLLAALLQALPEGRHVEVRDVPNVLARCWDLLGFAVGRH